MESPLEPNQFVQIPGAVLLLGAYLLLQAHLVTPRSWVFGWGNFLGSGLLAWEAGRTAQWGFLLVEGSWAVISLWALARLYLGMRALAKGARPEGLP